MDWSTAFLLRAPITHTPPRQVFTSLSAFAFALKKHINPSFKTKTTNGWAVRSFLVSPNASLVPQFCFFTHRSLDSPTARTPRLQCVLYDGKCMGVLKKLFEQTSQVTNVSTDMVTSVVEQTTSDTTDEQAQTNESMLAITEALFDTPTLSHPRKMCGGDNSDRPRAKKTRLQVPQPAEQPLVEEDAKNVNPEKGLSSAGVPAQGA